MIPLIIPIYLREPRRTGTSSDHSFGIGIANQAEQQPFFFSSGNISGALERMASRQQRAA